MRIYAHRYWVVPKGVITGSQWHAFRSEYLLWKSIPFFKAVAHNSRDEICWSCESHFDAIYVATVNSIYIFLILCRFSMLVLPKQDGKDRSATCSAQCSPRVRSLVNRPVFRPVVRLFVPCSHVRNFWRFVQWLSFGTRFWYRGTKGHILFARRSCKFLKFIDKLRRLLLYLFHPVTWVIDSLGCAVRNCSMQVLLSCPSEIYHHTCFR